MRHVKRMHESRHTYESCHTYNRPQKYAALPALPPLTLAVTETSHVTRMHVSRPTSRRPYASRHTYESCDAYDRPQRRAVLLPLTLAETETSRVTHMSHVTHTNHLKDAPYL